MTVQPPAGPVTPHGRASLADLGLGGSNATTNTPTRVHAPVPTKKRRSTGGAAVSRPAPRSVGVLPGSDVLPVVHTIVQRSVSHPEAPLSLALVVLLFLLIQHRIDRRDPKLAGAPRVEPADLEFGTAIRYA
ncbi:MAG: hypothetical protein QOI82_841 [Actinomycetota bacterium]|nr:hypothetical protein [Actinomycetota bacterium]